MRIVFTGGSGKAGRHAMQYLKSRGHHLLNLDLSPFPFPEDGIYTLKTDLTDSGQVFNALSSNFGMEEFENPSLPPVPDAVIHFGAIARNLLVPDNQTFALNTQSTYNVIEAACKLGVKKIIIASSETVYGVCFAHGDRDFHSFPLHEDLPVAPEDSYAISKVCAEVTARGFAARFGVDIYAFRIGNVIEPHEYVRDFPGFLRDPKCRKRNAWSYIDARDLGQMCDLAVTNKEQLGFQIFNCTNDNITVPLIGGVFVSKFASSQDFILNQCPNAKFSRDLGNQEAPMSNEKIRRLLGFKENHAWHKYVDSW